MLNPQIAEAAIAEGALQPDVRMHWGITIPLRDGTRLNATLYLPGKHAAPSPVLFTLTPYVGQSVHDQAVYFAMHAFPFLTVDVRGRGNSEGEFHPLDAPTDAHDVIEWIAEQPYCNGKVASWGGSYGGYVQWAAIKEPSVHLATIVPVASPYRGVDSPMRYNIFAPYTIQWLTLISGRTSQDKMFADRPFWAMQFRRWFLSGTPYKSIDSFLGNPSSLFQEWVSHPQQDEYWDSYNPDAQHYSQLRIPILTITGAYDANQLGALAHYREYMKVASPEARAHHYLIIGPWDHAGTRVPARAVGGLTFGPDGMVDLRKLHVEWYAWTMQGGAKPAFLQKRVAYYVSGAEKWRYADSLEEVTAQTMPLYLHSTGNPVNVYQSGALVTEVRPGVNLAHYIHDPTDLSLVDLESSIDPDSLVDQQLLHAGAGKRLIYHSEPFVKDTEISGFFELSAWLAIDRPDTDFRVWVYEIGSAGNSVLLTTDSLRARYRESFREPRLIQTTQPLRYEFRTFTFVSRQLKRGFRLRLVIGPIHSIYSQKNYHGGGVVAEESAADARVVAVKLFHGESYPSVLYVPLGQAE
jgi:uncharacterized protein